MIDAKECTTDDGNVFSARDCRECLIFLHVQES
jgi:hypothetical protein